MLDRKIHTLGVVKMSEVIRADFFPHLDRETVEKAATLHDITKTENQYELCASLGFTPDDDMKKSPAVLHAFTGALVCESRGESVEIINAVRYHTTGRPDMTPLEQIVFIADYIEENRTAAPCLEAREYYFSHRGDGDCLDKLTYIILNNTAEYCKSKGDFIYPLTLKALDFYRQKGNN